MKPPGSMDNWLASSLYVDHRVAAEDLGFRLDITINRALFPNFLFKWNVKCVVPRIEFARKQKGKRKSWFAYSQPLSWY